MSRFPLKTGDRVIVRGAGVGGRAEVGEVVQVGRVEVAVYYPTQNRTAVILYTEDVVPIDLVIADALGPEVSS